MKHTQLQFVNVDYKKIKEILSKNNKTTGSASIEMGCSRNYLSSANTKNRMPMPKAVLFAKLNNCSVEDILLDEPKEPEQKVQEEPVQQEVPAVTQETIAAGVYRGIGSAIAQYGDNFRDEIVSAVTEAVFQGLSQGVGRYKKDLMQDIRGAVFSAVYTAHQKLGCDKASDNVRSVWAKAE